VANFSIAKALAKSLDRDAARPLVTQIWAGGERAELSVRTFENNVAKAANLLQDEIESGPGSRILLQLPLHWQHSVWLTAGALVGTQITTLAGPHDSDVELLAAFVDGEHADQGFDFPTYVVSLHPLGLPIGAVPTGTVDLAREARSFSDVFSAYEIVTAHTPWLEHDDSVMSQSDAIDEATDLARTIGLDTGGRLLLSGLVNPSTIVALAALPLVLDASIVICGPGVDLDVVAQTERCTAVFVAS
jgi:uncharacterized protein (TIGR03089 family)